MAHQPGNVNTPFGLSLTILGGIFMNKLKQWAARHYRRLRPNASRVHLRRFLAQAASELSQSIVILDAGAGEGRYAELFSAHCYHAVDLNPNRSLSYVANLQALPARDASYDLVICTQVLEHVAEPLAVLRELYRALKPGGSLWLTVPFFFAEHMQPYDYYRYTRYGLTYLLRQAGFEIRAIQHLEGYLATLAYQLETAARHLPVLPSRLHPIAFLIAGISLLLKPLFFSLYILLDLADTVYKVDRGYSKNYAVIAYKPSA